MADDAIELSGGGVIGVASSELYTHAEIHRMLGVVAMELLHSLRGVDRLVSTTAIRIADAPVSTLAAETCISDALGALAAVHTLAAALPHLLHAAAEGYEIAERVGASFADAAGDGLAWIAGAVSKTINPLLLAGVGAAAALPALAMLFILSNGQPLEFIKQHPELYTAWLPSVTGGLADHGDAALLGAMGLPVWLGPLIGRSGIAKLVMGIHSFGAFKETPVRIASSVNLPPPEPPADLSSTLERTQTKEHGGGQVRVEIYTMADGSQVANVYVDGTEDWSPWSGTEPWDMTSNFGGVAQNGYVGSAEGVKAAMRAAGVTAEMPVQLFGYSQGGIQAAVVAHQHEFNVVTLGTVGAPVGSIVLDPSIQGFSIAHKEDPVFALDDQALNDQILQMRTERFAHDPLPSIPAPGHQFEPYRHTFERIDGDQAPRVQWQIDRFVGMTEGAVSSTSTVYTVERVPPD